MEHPAGESARCPRRYVAQVSRNLDAIVSGMPQDHALWMLSKWAEEARENERLTAEWVVKARDAGASWEQIGHALGVSRQAAQQRFGRNVP